MSQHIIIDERLEKKKKKTHTQVIKVPTWEKIITNYPGKKGNEESVWERGVNHVSKNLNFFILKFLHGR
jgi:hypothetical protein